jgi:O-antigen/teichoic acid export membrane protein
LPFLNQGIVSGSNFIVGILLARYLGIESYGLFVLAWLVILFASSLHWALVQSPLYTLSAKHKNGSRADFKSFMAISQLFFSALVFLVSILCESLIQTHLLENRVSELFVDLLPVTATLFVSYDYCRRSLYLENRFIKVIISDVLVYGLQGPAFFILNQFGFLDLDTALLVMIVLLAIGITMNIRVFQFKALPISTLKIFGKEVWQFSKFLLGTSVLTWLSGNYFIITAGVLLGPIYVGAFRIAQNVMGVLHVVLLSLENIIPIKAANIYDSNKIKGLINYLIVEFKKWFLVVFAFSTLVSLFASEIIQVVYGNQYSEYSWILTYYASIYILILLGTISRFFVRTVRANSIIFYSYVANTLFCVCTAKFLIGQFNIEGLLFGLYSAQVITLVVIIIMVKFQWKSFSL